jgi:TetR/AcrR family transcriptional regulator, transcriptional repressor for nem operon
MMSIMLIVKESMRRFDRRVRKMRYPAAETAAKHARIVDKASRLFRKRGFSNVSVAEIMKASGLTHGPFYNHFPSKRGLMVEAIRHATKQALKELENAPPSEDGKRAFRLNYLSTGHRDHPEDGCLLAALASEIGREPAVKSAVTTYVKTMIAKMSCHFPWTKRGDARGETIRMLTSMVGALVLARAVDDADLSREILEEAARQ